MRTLTLRHKYIAAMAILVVVSIIILFGNRLLGKSALFTYLEREHMANVLHLDASLNLAEQEAKNAGTLKREDLLKYIDTASTIAARAETELFYFEEQLFRLFGFGDVLDLPKKDVLDLSRMRQTITGMPGSGVTAELARQLHADKEMVLDNSDKFTVLVQDAVSFIKLTVTLLSMIAVVLLGMTIFYLARNTLGPIEAAIAVAQRIAKGDLSGRIEVRAADEFGRLFGALQQMNDNLSGIVSKVRTGTISMAGVTAEIASGNADLSSRTETQASSLEETAASMEELTATVTQNADSAQQANQLVMTASDHATKGRVVVGQVVETMGAITESSKRIADIIGVIDSIAFQTNILALNAAVEAARAGEQGRGFAVVAAEVRALAQRSAAAAKEIKELINASVGTVEAGAQLVDDAGNTMTEIVDSVTRVARIMAEISSASHEQSSGIAQVNQAIGQMDHVTQQNAALVEQAAAAAVSLREQAEELAKTVDAFTLSGAAASSASSRSRAVAVR